jgi:hypothetical protein
VNNSNYAITNSNSTPSSLTITNAQRGGLPIFSGTTIQGNINLVVNDPTGASNQVLTGNNTYSGGSTIIKGTLTAGSATALGSGPVTLAGGTLALTTTGTPIASTPILTPSSFNATNVTLTEGAAATFAPTFNGNTLTLTSTGVENTSNAAFYNTKVPVSDALGFTVQFNWNVSGGADGIAFVLQNDPRGVSAVGGGGNSLGYATGTNGAIVNSGAAGFEIYTVNANGLTFGSNGKFGPYISPSPVGLDQDINVTLVYNGPAQTLTETLVGADTTTVTTTFSNIDYSSLLGGPAGGATTAYIGFTGSTGAVTATQTISNFSYAQNLPYAQTPISPTSIANTVVAATGTTSAIQIGVFSSASTTLAAVGGISISSGATVNLTVPAGSALRGVLSTPSLSIATTGGGAFAGRLDLGSNDLIITGGVTLSQVTAMLASGYNGGNWNGQGIASSAAAANSNHLTALGVIVNDNGGGTPLYGSGGTISSTFDGATPSDGNILVKYTYYGDANLDGAVDGSDYALIDNAYLNNKTSPGSPLTGWQNGDFNYDGVIDGSDYALIDNAFNSQGGSLGSNPLAQVAVTTAQVAGSAVPEPAAISLLTIAGAGLLGRRRKQ